MVVTIALALTLVVLSVIIHYEVLRATSLLIPRLSISPRSRILVVIAGVFTAHIVEICLYTIAFIVMHSELAMGSVDGVVDGKVADFFYFSLTSYTTLGVGDLVPHGPLRIIAGIEALNGFVLIGWSGSFTYLSMEKLWELHPQGKHHRR